jgi:hypothetical protein
VTGVQTCALPICFYETTHDTEDLWNAEHPDHDGNEGYASLKIGIAKSKTGNGVYFVHSHGSKQQPQETHNPSLDG